MDTGEANNTAASETSASTAKRPRAASSTGKRPSRAKSSGKKASGKGKKPAKKAKVKNGAAVSTSKRKDYSGLSLLPGSYKQKLWDKLMANKNKPITQAAAVS